MKTKLTFCLTAFLLTASELSAQMAYHDALVIKQKANPKIQTITQKVNVNITSQHYAALVKALYPYMSQVKQGSIDQISSSIKGFMDQSIMTSADSTTVKGMMDQVITILSDGIADNPFIAVSGSVQSFDLFSLAGVGSSGSAKALVSSIGGLNATTFADGYAQFLIERANQELNIMFFDRFRDVLKESKEFQVVFPETFTIMSVSEPYEYASKIQILKEAFKEDFENLLYHLEDLANLEKYQELADQDDQFKFIFVSLAGVTIVRDIINGEHPADVLENLEDKDRKGYLHKIDNNLLPTFQMISVLSKSLRDTSNLNGFVKWADLKKNMLGADDEVVFRIFLGLVYQQFKLTNEEQGVVFMDKKGNEVKLASLLENNAELIGKLQVDYRNLGVAVNDVEKQIQRIKSLQEEGEKVNFLEYYNLVDYSLAILDHSLKTLESLGLNEHMNGFDDVFRYTYSARLSNQVFKNVREKNYSLAVLHFTSVLDTLFKNYDPRQRFEGLDQDAQGLELVKLNNEEFDFKSGKSAPSGKKQIKEELQRQGVSGNINKAKRKYLDSAQIDLRSTKFLKYATFMASIAEAESSEEVKNAISTAALPAGSASIKKNKIFNISINSYLGGFYGKEWLVADEGNVDVKTSMSTMGVWAPIGLAISKGTPNWDKPMSFTFYTSLLDVGPFASFRLQNPDFGNGDTVDGETVEDAEVEVLPEVQLKNLIAPGLYAIVGLPKCPFSVGAGYQWGPNLREIKNISTDGSSTIDTVEGKSSRFQVFFAFDIPVFNLFTSEN